MGEGQLTKRANEENNSDVEADELEKSKLKMIKSIKKRISKKPKLENVE